MSGYRNPRCNQMDGTRLAGSNCGCAVCTDLIDKATTGALRIGPDAIRKATGDTVGGVLDSDLIAAVWKLTKDTKYPVQLVARVVEPTKVDDLAESGRVFGGSISCLVTVKTSFATNQYTGAHKVYSADHVPGFYTNDDPGTSAAGYRQWPADLYYRAMEARTPRPGCLLLVAPDTEDVDVVAVMGGRFRATPSVTGKDLGPIPVGKTLHSDRTVNGGGWKRGDGGTSDGWWRFGPGKFAAGERMARAA